MGKHANIPFVELVVCMHHLPFAVVTCREYMAHEDPVMVRVEKLTAKILVFAVFVGARVPFRHPMRFAGVVYGDHVADRRFSALGLIGWAEGTEHTVWVWAREPT